MAIISYSTAQARRRRRLAYFDGMAWLLEDGTEEPFPKTGRRKGRRHQIVKYYDRPDVDHFPLRQNQSAQGTLRINGRPV